MVNFSLPDYKPTHTLSDFEFLHDPKDSGSKLGIGSFATVKLARDKKSGKLYALKLIDVDPKKTSKADIQNLKTEIQIHKELNHPNIIKFYGYIQEGNHVYLILEYAENGNLYTYMYRKKILTEKEVFRFFYQTCLAINYLHENDIIHRDIKPENLLLDKDFNIKVCDFGWSANHIKQERSTFCGTYEYMAPELVNKKSYDFRIDIWALGILLYELIHNRAPYKGRSMQEIKASMAKGQIVFNDDIQQDAKKLIQKILKVHPTNRILINQILEDSWVGYHLEREEVVRTSVYHEDIKPVPSANYHKLKIFDQITNPKLKSLHVITDSFQVLEGGNTARNETGVSHSATSLNHIKDLPKKETGIVHSASSLNLIKEYSSNTLHDRNLNVIPHSANDLNYFSKTIQTVEDDIISPLSSPRLPNLQPLGGAQKTPSKKKKIFDTNILSPAFNHRLNRIMDNLSNKNSFLQLSKHASVDGSNTFRVLNPNLVHQNSVPAASSPSDYFFTKKAKENSNVSSVTTNAPSNPDDEVCKPRTPHGSQDLKTSTFKTMSNLGRKAMNNENEGKITSREGENSKNRYQLSQRDDHQGITRINIFGDELSPDNNDMKKNRNTQLKSVEDFSLIKNLKNLWSVSNGSTPFSKDNPKQAMTNRRNF